MASLLLRPSALVVGLSFSSVLLAPLALRPRPLFLRCDASPEPLAGREWSYTRDARTPVRSQGRWNPQALKQVSAGSILGLIGGLAVSVFSKPLAVVIGLLVFGIQFIESRGIHIIPYASLQRRVQNTDLRSLVQDNVAFKLSFGVTFALAAFAEF
ncbi:uncharacterized protein K441DRAFT_694715 [Cenococcum geophilum 1.58]|uniref:uncharacterized protein n=1 Tax=Cenococcum geophilum 1.58 TaxID=794803 RepID=UPI00358EBB4A|nr:hypothetical protein K441DRAFT_694715 [Cenococcum geophilum 1.58]